jgi:predicted dehydrogenase
MGLFHVLAFPKLDDVEVTAICDPWAKALEGAGNLAPQAERFSDLQQMCASGAVDAVAIATPNGFHMDNVRTALEAGLHVYCEKPLANTVADCHLLAELADKAQRCVQTGFQHRFQHGYATAKRLVSSGEIGALQRAEMRATDWFRPNTYFAKRPWRGKWEQAGGGVLMMQAIHQLDAFLWTTGLPTRVTARAWRARPDVEVEDDVYALLEFAGGARGAISATTLDPAGRNRLDFTCDAGTLQVEGERLRRASWEDPTSVMLTERTNLYEAPPVSWQDVEPSGDALTYDACVEACEADFIDAIRSGRPPSIDPAEATTSVEVANAVYLSAITGEPVDLPLDPSIYDDAFARMCTGDLVLPALG